MRPGNRRRLGTGVCIAAILLLVTTLALHAGGAHAGCSDEQFEQSVALYQKAVSESSVEAKIAGMEQAFEACPAHGHHAQGYYELAKLYLEQGNKEKAISWLERANRFRNVLLQRSIKDLVDINKLLSQLFKESGNRERAAYHHSRYAALLALQGETPDKDYVVDAAAYYDVIYEPGTVKKMLAVDKDIPGEHARALGSLEVYFAPGSADLSETARKQLQAVGKALEDNVFHGCAVTVEGYTDAAGGRSYNRRLGKKRAEVVAEYLQESFDLKHIRWSTTSFGEDRAIPAEAYRGKVRNTVNALNRKVIIRNEGA